MAAVIAALRAPTPPPSYPEVAPMYKSLPIPVTRPDAPPPWKHQREAYWHVDHSKTGVGLFMDMGTGKSRVVVDYLNNHDTRYTLILCPLSVIPAWEKQFALYGTKAFHILALRDNLSVRRKVEEAEKALQLAHARRQPLVVIINYESAWRPGFGPIYDATGERIVAEGFALSMDWDVVVADEVHRIKDPSGRASRFVAKLRAGKRVGLTGTPMPHSPLDLFAIYRFLDPTIFGHSYFAFRGRYAIMGGYDNKEVIAFKNEDELAQKMYSIAYRVRAADVLDLPPAVHVERTCTLEPTAAKMYRDLYKKFIVEVEGGVVTAANAMVKLLRLQQLTSGYLRDEEKNDHEVSEAKPKLLVDILSDLDIHEPVAVFCRFQHDLDAVASAARVLGRTSSELSGRRNQLSEWQAGTTSVLAVQIQAGGVGIDLTRARYCVFYSLGFSLGDYEQALARVHRPGQDRSVTYVHLIAENTVDQLVYQALRERKDVVSAILDGIRKVRAA